MDTTPASHLKPHVATMEAAPARAHNQDDATVNGAANLAKLK